MHHTIIMGVIIFSLSAYAQDVGLDDSLSLPIPAPKVYETVRGGPPPAPAAPAEPAPQGAAVTGGATSSNAAPAAAPAVPELEPIAVPESSVVETFGLSYDDDEEIEYGDGDDSFSVGAMPKQERPRREVSAQAAPSGSGSGPEVYTIVEGDTLWDICERMLGDPFYWPKLWALNEADIANPHLIYPGQEIRFYSGTATSFPKVAIGKDNPVETIETGRQEGTLLNERSIAKHAGEGDMEIRLNLISVLSEKEIQAVGRVGSSVAPKMELSFGDYLYLSLRRGTKPAVGDRFHVIHRVGKISRPGSLFGSLGVMIRRAAVVQVTKISGSAVEARIVDSYESINRGDELVVFKDQVKTVTPSEGDARIAGQIVASDQKLILIGSQDFVYLDVGRKHGVSDGQRLSIVKKGDGLPALYGEGDNLPDVQIGRLMIVDTYEKTSMAYILSVDEELQVGARVRGGEI